MNNTSDWVRIKIRHNEQGQSIGKGSPREQFWSVFKRQERYGERSIESLETELTREFGPSLRRKLVKRISQGMRDAEMALYGSEMEKMLDEYRHFFHFWREKEWPGFYPYDPLSRLIEFRQQVLREVPAVKTAVEQLVALSDVFFSVRIEGYSSLNLGLSVSQVGKLVQAFESDFDSFRVFLDSFVPEAFGDVFDWETANMMFFDIDIPSTFRSAFSQTHSRIEPTSRSDRPTTGVQPQKPESLQRAEWLWKLANGSLLVPVILALLVLYFGFREIAALRTAQYEAIKPILEHHLQLLKEDRERFSLTPPFSSTQPLSRPVLPREGSPNESNADNSTKTK